MLPNNSGFKLFFYGTDTENIYLCQSNITIVNGIFYDVQITLKISNYVGSNTNISDAINNFMNYFVGNVCPKLL